MNPIKIAVGGFVTLFSLFILFASCYTISEQEKGVLTTWGKYSETQGSGLHFKVPIMQGINTYPITIQSIGNDVEHPLNTYTVDNQEVDAVIKVFFKIPPDKVEFIFKNVPDYETRLLAMAQDRFKREMGKINTNQVAEKRGAIATSIRDVLEQDVSATLGLEIVDFQIPNMEFNSAFKEAVNNSSVAKQAVVTAEQEKLVAQKVAEKAKIAATGTADAVKAQADGEAYSRLKIAESEAKAIKLRGEAEAAAIEAQAKALAQNSNLVELRKAENWNGQLPTWVTNQNPMPFLENLKAPSTP